MENKEHYTIRAIVTGSTGMVGEGVLHSCLQHPEVEAVLVINRKPCGVVHPKLKEIIHQDFFDLSSISEQLTGYNACFFCLGVSSIGMKEPEYYRLTYTLTMHVATLLSRKNPQMTFCYISGVGTDSSEKGRSMWARVKGKTENDLMKLPFKAVYAFRPGYIHPEPGMKRTLVYYKYLGWLYPVFRLFFPRYVSRLRQIGFAMINVSLKGYHKTVIDPEDIGFLS